MQVPLSVSFLGVPVSEAVRSACWAEAEKLERYYDRITSCTVTVSLPRRQRKGNHFAIRVHLAVPGGHVDVDRAPRQHDALEQPQLAVREAFAEARRRLQDHVRRLRGEVKHHAPPPDRSASGPA